MILMSWFSWLCKIRCCDFSIASLELGRYKICIWFRNFSVPSVFIRTNPFLNSAHGKGSAFPANLLYGWVRIGTESRGNQYGRTRSADNVFLRPESLLPNNTDRIHNFRCFYIDFSFSDLNFIFFRLYFHSADNWSMNYRHYDSIDLKSFLLWYIVKKQSIK